MTERALCQSSVLITVRSMYSIYLPVPALHRLVIIIELLIIICHCDKLKFTGCYHGVCSGLIVYVIVVPWISRVYSRLSLFRLSEVRPPRYTGHLAWHGMLAIYVYCTKLTLKYGHSLFCLPASAWLSPNKVFNVILYVYYGWI